MKIYKIERRPDKVVATVNDKPLRHVVYHSPTGFEFGYGGSGPADLALSILADYFGEKPTEEEIRWGRCRCWGPHQDFKWKFIAPQKAESFTVTELEITEWLKSQDPNS